MPGDVTIEPYTVRGLDESTWGAFAALVFDADGTAQGWAKYGRLSEQPIIEHNRRAYEAEPPARPDWRITCFYTDTRHRRLGVGRAALGGSLDLIAQAGGGLV